MRDFSPRPRRKALRHEGKIETEGRARQQAKREKTARMVRQRPENGGYYDKRRSIRNLKRRISGCVR